MPTLCTRVAAVVQRAIALVVADVTNPFYGDIIKGAYEATREAGYQLILSHTNESPRVERETIEQELAQVDGVVIASSRMTDSALRMVAKQKPVVLLNRIIAEANCVLNDAQRGIRHAVEHLAALGHERILYVAGRRRAGRTGCAGGRCGRPRRSCGWRRGGWGRTSRPCWPAAAPRLRVAELDATAVQVYNDQQAIGIVKGLQQLGVGVPERIGVIGFDNIIFDELVEPQLTTIASPLYRMGLTGVQNCIAVAKGARPSGRPLVLPVRLVVRHSTAQSRVVPRFSAADRSSRRNSTSPARGTTSVSGSAANAATSTVAGSR